MHVAHDPNRVLHHDTFDVKSSASKSWGTSDMLHCAKASFFRRTDNGNCRLNQTTVKGSDSNQLGADFIISGCSNNNVVSSSGTTTSSSTKTRTTTPKVFLSYYCKDPTDRIEISKIILTIQNYNYNNKHWQEQQ